MAALLDETSLAKKASAAKIVAPRKAPQAQASPLLSRMWNWLQKQNAFSSKKQLRVCETVSLGEKRFVAVVQIDGQKFLIGGGASGVSLLAELENDAEPEIDAALDRELKPPKELASLSRMFEPLACAGGQSR